MFDPSTAVIADASTRQAVTPRPETLARPKSVARIVEAEAAWRTLPAGRMAADSGARVIVTRWCSLARRTQEVEARTPVHNHLVAVVLRTQDVRFALAGRTIHDGAAVAGMVQVTKPGVAVNCLFRGPHDVLHLHVPNRLIAEFNQDIGGANPAALPAAAPLRQDPVAERLGRALLAADEPGNPFGRLYADGIATAIVARLLGAPEHPAAGARPRVAELARWRLRRVTEYVDANLGEPVSLADLAAAAGLTRMHFAAQFRAATGLPPHEYLLRRRIERAQEMVADRTVSLVEIALSVGFQTQSHFTSVFKRFTGQPPRAWRQSVAGADCPAARHGTPALEQAAA
jgi:AraC family transcriptional regulator